MKLTNMDKKTLIEQYMTLSETRWPKGLPVPKGFHTMRRYERMQVISKKMQQIKETVGEEALMSHHMLRYYRQYIAALRSGKYVQLRGLLHSGVPNEFCPLGLAMELFRQNNLEWEWVKSFHGGMALKHWNIVFKFKYLLEMFKIESDVLKYVVILNDDKGLSFSEIADYLEEKYNEKYKELV